MITDEYIKLYFKGQKTSINIPLVSQYYHKKGKDYNKEIFEYIEKRYDDSKSFKESLYRILNRINICPKCKYCGKQLIFDLIHKKYYTYCSQSCKAHDLINKGIMNTPDAVNKQIIGRKKTMIKKYGVDNPFKSPIIRKEIEEKMIKKYGCKNFLGSEYINSIRNNKEIQSKIINTKRKNHTFNTSKFEEEMFLYIKKKFHIVKRQYKDNMRYPYNCDFYIPELDYFIELQGYYTHGKHPYNPNSIEDQILVERYKEKYGPDCQAITIWTIKDVEKRECAKNHNLNFKEIWTLEEGKKFIDSL